MSLLPFPPLQYEICLDFQVIVGYQKQIQLDEPDKIQQNSQNTLHVQLSEV